MIISTDALTWNAKTSTFTSEASDDPEAGSRLVQSRLCGGLKRVVLWNPMTDAMREFTLDRTATTIDGEIIGWEFSCPQPRMRLVIRNSD